MMELTINGTVYQFKFGIGFMREINKTVKAPVDGIPNEKKDVGLRMKIIGLYDGDIEDLIDILDAANKTQDPRISRKIIEDYIEDEETDIDKLFNKVLDFLSKANVTRKAVTSIKEQAKAQGINL